MRDDFSKQLVERERIHSWDKFHNYRHKRGPTGLNDDEVGGRQSMRRPYNHGYDRKSFNENLNPLYGWVRTCIGKNWNKCYSELRKKFDARSVINNHILEHLWQLVETNTFVDENGRSMVRPRDYALKGNHPVSECLCDYYVCPKTGVLRATNRKSLRQIRRINEAKKREEQNKITRKIGDNKVLHLIDGVWYAFDLLPVPILEVEYVPSLGNTSGLYSVGSYGKKVLKRWDEMNFNERRIHGTQRTIGSKPKDEFTKSFVFWYNEVMPQGQVRLVKVGTNEKVYHANKRQASKKDLKEAGLK